MVSIDLIDHLAGSSDHYWTMLEPGLGVTKAPFVNFSVTGNFDLAKVYVIDFQTRSYLSGVSAAQLR